MDTLTAKGLALSLGGKKVGKRWMALCPAHDDHKPSLDIGTGDDGKVLFHCYAGCSQEQVLEKLRGLGLWGPSGQQSGRHQDARSVHPEIARLKRGEAHMTEFIQRIWEETESARGTRAEKYLNSRGLYLPSLLDLPIRFHRELAHPTHSHWPSMVARVQGLDKALMSIHRTFLASDGPGKAPVEPQRMMLGPCSGGAVQFGEPSGQLMVGEGIETCLSAMQATEIPVWAALSTAGLKALDLPPGVREVIVLADGDDSGAAAAQKCAQRWQGEGRRVRIASPPSGQDFNDMLIPNREAWCPPSLPLTPDGIPVDNLHAIRDVIENAKELPELSDENFNYLGKQKSTQSDTLFQMAREAEFSRTPDNTIFADLHIDGHRETWPLESERFTHWLMRRYFEETNKAPPPAPLQTAIRMIEAHAQTKAPERLVFMRVGEIDGKLYFDLADKSWHAVEITATGWQVISNPPVRFRRTPGMKPLPAPARDGGIQPLQSFLNLQEHNDFVLVVCWLLAALRPTGPYPVLALSGEQGSAKSTFSKILRALIDPNAVPLRALPREPRDLFIAANNSHVLAFDNISFLSNSISDNLCQLSTGTGFAVRKLYSDRDESLFTSGRPLILNGIENSITRADLSDRAVFLNLRAIPEEKRRTEEELEGTFKANHAQILGALFDGLAEGLKQIPYLKLSKISRMADFVKWAMACEGAFWPKKKPFSISYQTNRASANYAAIADNPVGTTVREFMSKQKEWTGTATELLTGLSDLAGEAIAKAGSWPANARAMSGCLRRIAPSLRGIGIEIDYKRASKEGIRLICITNPEAEERGHEADRKQPHHSCPARAEPARAEKAQGRRSKRAKRLRSRRPKHAKQRQSRRKPDIGILNL